MSHGFIDKEENEEFFRVPELEEYFGPDYSDFEIASDSDVEEMII